MPAVRVRDLVGRAPAPGAFAAVMATGIVSVAASEHGQPTLSAVLAGIAVAVFVALVIVVMVRTAAGQSPVAGRLLNPGTAVSLFSAVAACAVLGARFVAERTLVLLFGALGLAGWLALLAVTVRALGRHPVTALRAQVRGAWLLPTVATAGLVITAADLREASTWLLATAVCGWVASFVLYLGAIALIGGRLASARRGAEAPGGESPDGESSGAELLGGDSWIVMGALAICTLAGDRLLRAAPATAWLDASVRPATLACWVAASVLLVVVLAFLVGAHARRAGRAGATGFTVFWWAAVFPQGMYSVATRATADQFHLRVLPELSQLFFWISLAAWLLTVAALVRALPRAATPTGWPAPG